MSVSFFLSSRRRHTRFKCDWSSDVCSSDLTTSQFEQQLRAICGLPLGATELLRPAAMANLLGDIWTDREPDWLAACALDDVKLHLYGKLQQRKGRKMGHLTALAADPAMALARVQQARRALGSEQ